jgi:flagellar capping protein FliD
MTGLQLNVGLMSGINYAELVEQLIKIDSIPRDNLEIRTTRLDEERTALTEMMSKFLKASYMLTNLNKAKPFLRTDVFSSNPNLISVTKTGTPLVGSYTFTPIQMASAQQTVAKGVISDKEALGKTGTITLGKGWSLESEIQLSDLNGGMGFSKGSIRITDGSGTRTTIDLRKAMTIKDVVNAINDNDNVDVIAELDGDHIVLRDVSGGDLSKFSVQEVSGGSTAASLGLIGRTVDSNGVMNGSSIWRLGETTSINLLNDGNGLVFDSFMPDLTVFCKDGTSVNIDFYRRTTEQEKEAGAPEIIKEVSIGDIINTINNSTDANGVKGKISAKISDDGKGIVIVDNTTGGGLTRIQQNTVLPVLRMLGLTDNDKTATIDMFTGLTEPADAEQGNAGKTAKMFFQDKAGNNAVIELDHSDISLIRNAYNTGVAGYGATYAAMIISQKLDAAGVHMEIKSTSDDRGLYAIDTSGGTGEMLVTDHASSDLATRLGLTNTQETEGVTALTGATPGSIRFTDQEGKTVDVTMSRTELDAIRTADDLKDLFTAKLAGSGVGISVDLNAAGTGLKFSDTTGGTTTAMRITDIGGGNTAARLGLTTTRHTDFDDILSTLTPGDISITDQSGNTDVISISQADLDAVHSVSDLIVMFNSKFGASGVSVEVLAGWNGANNGLIFKDTSGGTSSQLQITDSAGTLMADLGFSATQKGNFESILSSATPGDIRFIDQDGNSVDINITQGDIDGISSLADLASLFNTKLGSSGTTVGIHVAVNGANTGLMFQDTTGGGTTNPLQVVDVVGGGSNLATRLGLTNSLPVTLSSATPGEVRFIDQNGTSADIDITQSDLDSITSLDDLAALFNNKLSGTPVGITVGVDSTGTRLTFTDTTGSTAHPIQVYDAAGNGSVARLLGLKNSATEFFATFTPGTIALEDASGATMEFAISQSELDGLTSLADLASLFNTKINGTVGITVEINSTGDGLVFDDTSGGAGSLMIGELTGTAIISKLGLTFGTTDAVSQTLINSTSQTSILITPTDESSTLLIHEFASSALENHYADSIEIVSHSLGNGGTINPGMIGSRDLIGGLDSVLMSSLNGGFGLSNAKAGGAIEVQDRAGHTANIVFSQADLNSMQTLADAVKLYNKKLSDAGIGITVSINDQKTGLALRDTTGSGTHNLIFRDLTTSSVIPGSPEVPGIDAVTGPPGNEDAAWARGGNTNGMKGTVTLFFNEPSSAALGGFKFGFTTNAADAGYNAATRTITTYLDETAILASADSDQDVVDAINSQIASAWTEIFPPSFFATYGAYPPPTITKYANISGQALTDASSGEQIAISNTGYGNANDYSGVLNGRTILTFEETDVLNGAAFRFTTDISQAGTRPGADWNYTFYLAPEILAETDPDRQDAMVKAAIEDQIKEYTPAKGDITVKLVSGMAADAIYDAYTGGKTIIGYNAGAVMGQTHVDAVPDTPVTTSANIASSFGLNVNSTSSIVNGTTLNRQVISYNTPLSELNGGAGVNMLGAKIILTDSAGSATTIQLDGNSRTVGEVLEYINTRVGNVKVVAKISENGDGIVFEEFAGGTRSFSCYDADSTSKFATSLGISGSVTQANKDPDGRMRLSASETHYIEVEAKDSLEDIRKKINDLNVGYSASILVDGSSTPYRLSISSKQTGASGAFNVDMSAIGLTTETMSLAKDAKIVYGDINTSSGLILSSNTNTFKGVINGVDLTIAGVSDSPVTITSESSNLDVKVSLETFVENYNIFRKQLNTDLYFQVGNNGVEGNILWNSSVAKAFDRDITDMLLKTITGIPGVRSLADLGISIRRSLDDTGLNEETGTLSFDADKFEEAWARDPEAVQKFFFDEREYTDKNGNVTTVNYGWAQKFSDLVDTLVGSVEVTGKTPARINTLTEQIDRNMERISFLEGRLEFKRQMYLKQFYAMEQAMARMTSDMSAVSNIASSWSSNYNSGA